MSWLIRNVKTLSLGCLVAQNCALVLTMRYSLTVEGPRYISSTAVALMEILKLAVCFAVVYLESGELRTFSKKLRVEVAEKPREMAKLMIPAMLYTLQNNMLYMALENLDAATYSVCYQTKILTTALFSVVLLRRKLSTTKWGALVLLAIGVALAQLSSQSTNSHKADESSEGQSPVVGFLCVMGAACTSGFAGVYFEMLLKGSKTSLWIRNIQMGIPSIVLAIGSVLVKDWRAVTTNGFFFGYGWVVVAVIVLQAVGGLVVAVVVKYADNIRKSFATAISIIISCALSSLFFAFRPTFLFFIGSAMVVGSVFLYTKQDRPARLPLFNKGRSVTRRV
ncbi:unnamed protein product [Ectocarpus fasciculatus]